MTLASSDPSAPLPKRGEVWAVNFDPTVGTEIKKTRPAVVISSDAVGRLPIKLIAPVTDWKEHYSRNIWHVRIEPDRLNGLSKVSSVDALQLRGMDTQRFVRHRGHVSATVMEEIVAAVAGGHRVSVAQPNIGRWARFFLVRSPFLDSHPSVV